MTVPRIDVYSHHFSITNFDDRHYPAIRETLLPLVQYKLEKGRDGRYRQTPDKTYASTNKDKTEYRIPITCYNQMLASLYRRGFGEADLAIVHHQPYAATKVKFKVNPKYVPRDYQEVVLDFMKKNPNPISVLPLQTGKGKTLIGLMMAAFFGVRTIIQLRGKYIDSWIHDIKDILGIKKKGGLLVIRGERDLRNLQLMALGNEIEAKIIIVSTDTMRGYIDRYIAFKNTEEAELIAPVDFCKALGVGFKIVDETHEVTHMASRIDTHTHVNHCLYLSATLDNDDQFINRMYNVYYPPHCRCPEVEYDKYIQATALLYRFKNPQKLKTSYKKGQYSHAAFEESILENPSYMGPYFTMIGNLVSNIYMDNREEGQKLLIVSALQTFSMLLETYLRARFPTVSINTFLFGDELSSLKESDISLSTFGSSGTGKDIPGLRYVIMQLSINSRSANRQTLGRLRRLKDWPDCTPEFYYLVCEDIPKQVEYHQNKYEVFRGRVLGHKELILSERV